jgi:carbon storage regulator
MAMLVLSRKCQEAIAVGEAVGPEPLLKVTVLEIKSGNVRLGLEAGAGLLIHRWEVWERIRTGDVPGGPTAMSQIPAA